jgi:hypothetical protein
VRSEGPGRVADGSVWDEILDTKYAIVVRAYIEKWPRNTRRGNVGTAEETGESDYGAAHVAGEDRR